MTAGAVYKWSCPNCRAHDTVYIESSSRNLYVRSTDHAGLRVLGKKRTGKKRTEKKRTGKKRTEKKRTVKKRKRRKTHYEISAVGKKAQIESY